MQEPERARKIATGQVCAAYFKNGVVRAPRRPLELKVRRMDRAPSGIPRSRPNRDGYRFRLRLGSPGGSGRSTHPTH